MVAQVAMSGPYEFAYPGGALALENVLVATAAKLGFEHGMAAVIRTGLRVQRRMRRVSRDTAADPGVPAGPGRPGGLVRGLADPPGPRRTRTGTPCRLRGRRPGARGPGQPAHRLVGRLPGPGPGRVPAGCATAAATRSGWSSARGRTPRRSTRPSRSSWARRSAGCGLTPPTAVRTPARARTNSLPVRVHVGGAGEWRDLADWPPPEIGPPALVPGRRGRPCVSAEPPRPARASPRSAMTRQIPPRRWAASCSPARRGPRTTGPWRPVPTSWSSPAPRWPGRWT